jgi:hypothetical protein
VDADESEHRVVAAEGEPAAARAADAAAPGDRQVHAAAEAAVVEVGEHLAEVVDAPARHQRRQLARRAAHAMQVLVHEAAHLAVGRGAVAADVARECRDDCERRVQEHAVQPHERPARDAPHRQQHGAVVGDHDLERPAGLARERRLERASVPARNFLERELELAWAHGDQTALRIAQHGSLVKRPQARTRGT